MPSSTSKKQYNYLVPKNNLMRWPALILLLAMLLNPTFSVLAARRPAAPALPAQQVSAFDLILAMNSLRVARGLPALIEDPIIMAVAQSTAQTMAASQMSGHIGNVSGRLQSAGYGGGAKVWATENFAVGNHSIDEIMVIWSDADHMIPAVNPAYCHVGAGVADAGNGRNYYILQAAYTASNSCGEYQASSGGSQSGSGGTAIAGVSPFIVPVKIATPNADGKIFHEVQSGQSFWSIAIAYQITIKDLEDWNNISRDFGLRIGQKLFIPSGNTEGYAKPTAVGMVQVTAPDASGKVIHVVQPYQTLSTISQAYKVSVDTILALNGLQIDWPLQIDQKLLIQLNATPGASTGSDAPLPASALEQLTPDSDGLYYHIVQSGQTLSSIAGLYKVSVAELMAWNGLDAASILYPNQKLLLQVTPPPTRTSTPSPPTATPAPRPVALDGADPASGAPVASPAAALASEDAPAAPARNDGWVYLALFTAATGGLLLFLVSIRKK
jgi:LysM repeat protein